MPGWTPKDELRLLLQLSLQLRFLAGLAPAPCRSHPCHRLVFSGGKFCSTMLMWCPRCPQHHYQVITSGRCRTPQANLPFSSALGLWRGIQAAIFASCCTWVLRGDPRSAYSYVPTTATPGSWYVGNGGEVNCCNFRRWRLSLLRCQSECVLAGGHGHGGRRLQPGQRQRLSCCSGDCRQRRERW
jgi:hypothetical protein